MAVVIPARGETVAIAKLLLSLTDNPYHVQTTTEFSGGTAFVIPDELHKKYLAAIGQDDEPDDDTDTELVEPVKRRPGRPRKIVPAAVAPDESDTEEE